jgi:GT2 family glycosyltransferase
VNDLLSIIIPSHARAERLRACLRSLAAAPGSRSSEVIVVDDGSPVALEHALAELRDALALRFLRLEGAGLNAARNHGAAAASGDLLAFLDDDTLVRPEWPTAMREALATPGIDAVGGRVSLAFEGTPPPWLTRKLRRYLAEFELGPDPRWLDGEPVPVGANCGVTREAFEAARGFAGGLDRRGESLLSNGDTDFFRRLQSTGYRIRYVPSARVEHCVPAERLGAEFFRRRAYAQGRSDALLAQRVGEATAGAWRERVRMGRSAPIAVRGVLAGRGAVTAAFWVQYCRGRMDVVTGSRR